MVLTSLKSKSDLKYDNNMIELSNIFLNILYNNVRYQCYRRRSQWNVASDAADLLNSSQIFRTVLRKESWSI